MQHGGGFTPLGVMPESSGDEPKRKLWQLLTSYTVYDILPESAKVVVFDLEVPMNKCFGAFVENDLSVAAVWDSAAGRPGGILSNSDFSSFLRRFHEPGTDSASRALGAYSIRMWRSLEPHGEIPYPSPESTLLDVCRALTGLRSSSAVPIIDDDQMVILSMLGFLPILRFCMFHLTPDERESLFSANVREVGVGTYDAVYAAKPSDYLRDVLALMSSRGISAIPLLNDSGSLMDVYSQADITFLARDNTLSCLDKPVGEIRQAQLELTGAGAPVPDKFSPADTVLQVINRFLELSVSRLLCVNEMGKCCGVVSWRDLAALFVSICSSVTSGSEDDLGDLGGFGGAPGSAGAGGGLGGGSSAGASAMPPGM